MQNVFTVKQAFEDETIFITDTFEAAKGAARMEIAKMIVNGEPDVAVRIYQGYELIGFYGLELIHIESV